MSRGARGVQPGWMGSSKAPGFKGIILNGCLVAWSCDHSHETRNDAQQCANDEARRRGIPVSASPNNGASA